MSRRARAAVAYAELLQLQRALRRRRPPWRPERRLRGALPARVAARLRFALTRGQEAALREIGGGLSAGSPSARLLQGDVGCGKTLVALLAAAWVVEAGEQVAFIVPTELLAHPAPGQRLPASRAGGDYGSAADRRRGGTRRGAPWRAPSCLPTCAAAP